MPQSTLLPVQQTRLAPWRAESCLLLGGLVARAQTKGPDSGVFAAAVRSLLLLDGVACQVLQRNLCLPDIPLSCKGRPLFAVSLVKRLEAHRTGLENSALSHEELQSLNQAARKEMYAFYEPLLCSRRFVPHLFLLLFLIAHFHCLQILSK